MVHILAGLEPGEPVLLAPPLDTMRETAESTHDDAMVTDAPSPDMPAPDTGANDEGKRTKRMPKEGAERRQRPQPNQEQP